MAPEKKRAWTSLIVLILFGVGFAVLFRARGSLAFHPPVDGTPWISVLSGLCVLALAGSFFLFRRGLGAAELLGDERERDLALRAGLLAKSFVLALLFGAGIWLETAAGESTSITMPRRAIGFALAALMSAYLGARAVAVLFLYGRE